MRHIRHIRHILKPCWGLVNGSPFRYRRHRVSNLVDINDMFAERMLLELTVDSDIFMSLVVQLQQKREKHMDSSCLYYINTSEIPSERSCKKFISSHVKITILP